MTQPLFGTTIAVVTGCLHKISMNPRHCVFHICLVLLGCLSLEPGAAEADVPTTAGTQPKVEVSSISAARAAAENGDPVAQHFLGNVYLSGDGVAPDAVEAARWFKLAAAKNDALSQFALGMMHADGLGVPQDRAEAVNLYRKAAEQGVIEAQFNLGASYAKGEGVERDPAEAAKWFQKAAERWDVRGQLHLGLAYRDGVGVEKNEREAVRWLRAAAFQSNPEAQFLLSRLLAEGSGEVLNAEESVRWLQRAAEQNHIEALHLFGMALLRGNGVAQDAARARDCFERAAQGKHTRAQLQLGLCYWNGEGVEVNAETAVRWISLAAEAGDPDARMHLGLAFLGGRGVGADRVQAIQWLRRAANQGHTGAQSLLIHLAYDEMKRVAGGTNQNQIATAQTNVWSPASAFGADEPGNRDALDRWLLISLSNRTETLPTGAGTAVASAPATDRLFIGLLFFLTIAGGVAGAVFLRRQTEARFQALELELRDTRLQLAQANTNLCTLVDLAQRSLATSPARPVPLLDGPLAQDPAGDKLRFKARRAGGAT